LVYLSPGPYPFSFLNSLHFDLRSPNASILHRILKICNSKKNHKVIPQKL
jgi:hypothetical protein